MNRNFHNPKQIVLRFNNPNRTKDKTYADIWPWLINQQNRLASVHLLIGLAQHYFGNKDFVKVTSENLRQGVMPFGNGKQMIQSKAKKSHTPPYKPHDKPRGQHNSSAQSSSSSPRPKRSKKSLFRVPKNSSNANMNNKAFQDAIQFQQNGSNHKH